MTAISNSVMKYTAAFILSLAVILLHLKTQNNSVLV